MWRAGRPRLRGVQLSGAVDVQLPQHQGEAGHHGQGGRQHVSTQGARGKDEGIENIFKRSQQGRLFYFISMFLYINLKKQYNWLNIVTVDLKASSRHSGYLPFSELEIWDAI